MPNYLYKCKRCKDVVELTLPISTDPKQPWNHPGHKNVCLGMFYRIMRSPSAVKGLKVFAGDWFKKQYGHDLGAAGMTRAEFQNDLKKAEEKHKREME